MNKHINRWHIKKLKIADNVNVAHLKGYKEPTVLLRLQWDCFFNTKIVV